MEARRELIKRKNSAEEKVKEQDKKLMLDDEKFQTEVPRKSSKEKVLSPRFFVSEKEKEKPTDVKNPYKKI